MGQSLSAAANRTGLVAIAAVAATLVSAGLILANLFRIENPDHGGHIPYLVQGLLWIAAGLYVTRAWPMSLIGPVIILGGFSHFLYVFGVIPTSGTFVLGRVLGGLQALVLVYLFLSYPSGVLRAGVDRTIMIAIAAWWAISSAADLLVDPHDLNPVQLITDPGIRSLVWDGTPIVTGVIALFALWRVFAHRQEAEPQDRRLHTPIVVAAVVTYAILALGLLQAVIGTNALSDLGESWPVLLLSGIAFPAAAVWVVTRVAPNRVPVAAHVEGRRAEAS